MSFAALLSHGWLVAFFALWVGLAVGSFLNVVIYRLPTMLQRRWRRESEELLGTTTTDPITAAPARFDLIEPRSHCGHCGTQIAPRHNIPVLSFIWLRGRCHHCNAKISPRYPLVEILTALCSVAVIAKFGYGAFTLAALIFTWSLIALAFIDLDTRLLPDSITLPLLWLGLASNIDGGLTDLTSSVIGAMAGYSSLWSIYWAFKWLTGKEGMGYGDFKLLAALGAWFGWQALPVLVLMSSLAGVAIGGTYLLIRRSREPIPFGPFLALAGWVTLLAHDRVVALVL